MTPRKARKSGRDGRIRTGDPLTPSQVRYPGCATSRFLCSGWRRTPRLRYRLRRECAARAGLPRPDLPRDGGSARIRDGVGAAVCGAS